MVSPRAISSPSIKFAIISSTSIFPRWLTSSVRPVISTRRSLFAVTSSIVIIASFSTEFIPCSSSVVFVVAVSHSGCQKGKNRGQFLNLQEQEQRWRACGVCASQNALEARMLSPDSAQSFGIALGRVNFGSSSLSFGACV